MTWQLSGSGKEGKEGVCEDGLVERVHLHWGAENNRGGGARADAQVCGFLGKSWRQGTKDGWNERLAGLRDVRGQVCLGLRVHGRRHGPHHRYRRELLIICDNCLLPEKENVIS